MPEAKGKISVAEVADALLDAKKIAATCKHTSRDECHPSEVVGGFVIPSPTPSSSPTPSVTPSSTPSPSPAPLGVCPMTDARYAKCEQFLLDASKSTNIQSDLILDKLAENECDVVYSHDTRIEVRVPVCKPSCPGGGSCNPVIGEFMVQAETGYPQCIGPMFGPAYRQIFKDGLPVCQDLGLERYTPWDMIWMKMFYSSRSGAHKMIISNELKSVLSSCGGGLQYLSVVVTDEPEILVNKACSLTGM